MTMTRKLNIDNGLQEWKTEHQAVTGGIFYCRDSAGFSVSASNKLLSNLTGQCSEIGNKNIPPNRYPPFERLWETLQKMRYLKIKILLIGTLLCITILGCNMIKGIKYINKKIIDPKYLSYNEKSLIFVPIVHVGEYKFYQSLKDSIIAWKSDNYTIFYEKVITDKTIMDLDSLTYVRLKRKARKAIDLSFYIKQNYKEKIDKVSENKVIQPDYEELGITNSDINADVNLVEIINEYERLYGDIELDSCDYIIPIDSNGTCRRLRNNLDPIIHDFRNQELARKISESEFTKIVIVYGALHIKPVIEILRNKKKTVGNN